MKLKYLLICMELLSYRTQANRPRSVYSIFHFFACGLFKKSVYLDNPENQEPVELEEIPDVDELDNNELLMDDVYVIY